MDPYFWTVLTARPGEEVARQLRAAGAAQDQASGLQLRFSAERRWGALIEVEAPPGRSPYSPAALELLLDLLEQAQIEALLLQHDRYEGHRGMQAREVVAALARVRQFELDEEARGLVLRAPQSAWWAGYLAGQGRGATVFEHARGAMLLQSVVLSGKVAPWPWGLDVPPSLRFSLRRWWGALPWLDPVERQAEHGDPDLRGVRRWWFQPCDPLEAARLQEVDAALAPLGLRPAPGPLHLAEAVLPALRGLTRPWWPAEQARALHAQARRLVEGPPEQVSLAEALPFTWTVTGLRRYQHPEEDVEALFFQIQPNEDWPMVDTGLFLCRAGATVHSPLDPPELAALAAVARALGATCFGPDAWAPGCPAALEPTVISVGWDGVKVEGPGQHGAPR